MARKRKSKADRDRAEREFREQAAADGGRCRRYGSPPPPASSEIKASSAAMRRKIEAKKRPTGMEAFPLVRRQIVATLVRALKEFGFPSATADNATSDRTFATFCRSSLEDAIELAERNGKDATVLGELLAECERTIAKPRGGKR